MNKTKFSLADVITLVAAIPFGFVCFLSTNFYTLGNTYQSIILAVIISFLLSGTALVAKLLKHTNGNFKTCFIWEIIVLVLFTVLTLFFAYSPFPHFFVVSSQKSEIQNKLSSNITQAQNMFAEYERYAVNRENLYRSTLRSVTAAKNTNPSVYASYGFVNSGVTDIKQIENKMFTVHADLFPTNYSDKIKNNGIKEVATIWLSDAKNKITGWKPIGIVDVVNEVEQKSSDWLKTLVELSTVREQGEQASNFEYSLSFDNVKKHFTTLGKPTPLSVGLAVLAYLLMLLSWIATRRHTRFLGVKAVLGVGKSTGNEL